MPRRAGASQAPRAGLADQVERTRLWLPLAIVAFVLAFELALLPLLPEGASLLLRVGFYSLIGPTVTFLTLNWIAREVRARERAQAAFAATHDELQESHELLSAIQRVTERMASAPDLEAAVRSVVVGVREVTGGDAAAVLVGSVPQELMDHDNLDAADLDRVRERDALLRAGEDPGATQADGGRRILSAPLRLGDAIDGSLHALFDAEPSPRAREGLGILAGEFASVAEAVRGRMRDLLTLFDVDRSIRAEGNLARLLSSLLERTMRRVGATRGAVYLADESPLLAPRVVRGAEGALPLRVDEGTLAPALAAGEPLLIHDVDAALQGAVGPLLAGARQVVALPLRSDGEPLGLVLTVHERPGAVTEEQLPFLALLAGQVSLAIRNARAYLQAEELAIGEERARIARDIHDGVAQSLAFAALKIDLGRRLAGRDHERAERELGTAADTVRESIREVRRSIFALRPVDLERHGLLGTMQRYLDDFAQQNDLSAEVELGPLPALDVRSEVVLFRIFQEAMHNVAKHARAGRVRVRLGTDPEGRAFVEVHDDGVGFDVDGAWDRVTSAGGLGLRQMRERVESRGGAFRIDSARGTGTTVRAAVP